MRPWEYRDLTDLAMRPLSLHLGSIERVLLSMIGQDCYATEPTVV